MTNQKQLAEKVYSSLTEEDLIFIAKHEEALLTGLLRRIGEDCPKFFYKHLPVGVRLGAVLRPQQRRKN